MEPQSAAAAPAAAPTVVTPTPAEIAAILAAHNLWVIGDPAGKRAILEGFNLSRANLSRANLSRANLSRANLDGANLAPGETWEQYLAEVLPALLTAAGKSLDEVMATGCWDCHTWDNCPMHAAFDIRRASEGPALLRPRIEQFVRFFDAKLIAAEKDESGKWVFRSATKPKAEGKGQAEKAAPAA